MDLVLVAVGLAALVAGANLVVHGGAALAARLGIPRIVVGLTVVSIGTSLPELAIGIDAAARDAGALAIGNIAGTNIVNLLLILGLSAAFVPLAIDLRTIRFELPIIAGVSILLLVLALDGELSRLDAAVLLTIAVAYTTAVVVIALRDPGRAALEGPTREVPSVGRAVAMLVAHPGSHIAGVTAGHQRRAAPRRPALDDAGLAAPDPGLHHRPPRVPRGGGRVRDGVRGVLGRVGAGASVTPAPAQPISKTGRISMSYGGKARQSSTTASRSGASRT